MGLFRGALLTIIGGSIRGFFLIEKKNGSEHMLITLDLFPACTISSASLVFVHPCSIYNEYTIIINHLIVVMKLREGKSKYENMAVGSPWNEDCQLYSTKF